jgi:hypothetical protein
MILPRQLAVIIDGYDFWISFHASLLLNVPEMFGAGYFNGFDSLFSKEMK